MSYITIQDLPEQKLADLDGSEWFVIAEDDSSYKVSFSTVLDGVNDVLTSASQTLTNKVINDVTNHVHANAIHYRAYAEVDLAKGQPVKLVEDASDGEAHVIACGNFEDSFGVAENDINAGEYGEIIITGMLENVDTSMYTEGKTLYIKDNSFIDDENIALNEGLIAIGIVINSDANNGKIYVGGMGNSSGFASSLGFDNTGTSLTSTNLQNAIVELDTNITNLDNRIDTEVNNINTSITTLETNINSDISELDITINNRITNLETTVNDEITEINNAINSLRFTTTDKILIANKRIDLPSKSHGDVVFNMAQVYNFDETNVYVEYRCSVSADGLSVIFNTDDNLDGKYAIVSYFTITD